MPAGVPLPLPNTRLTSPGRCGDQRGVRCADLPQRAATEDSEGGHLWHGTVRPRGLSGQFLMQCGSGWFLKNWDLTGLNSPQAGAQISLADVSCSEEKSTKWYNLLSRLYMPDISSKEEESREARGSERVTVKHVTSSFTDLFRKTQNLNKMIFLNSVFVNN